MWHVFIYLKKVGMVPCLQLHPLDHLHGNAVTQTLVKTIKKQYPHIDTTTPLLHRMN